MRSSAILCIAVCTMLVGCDGGTPHAGATTEQAKLPTETVAPHEAVPSAAEVPVVANDAGGATQWPRTLNSRRLTKSGKERGVDVWLEYTAENVTRNEVERIAARLGVNTSEVTAENISELRRCKDSERGCTASDLFADAHGVSVRRVETPLSPAEPFRLEDFFRKATRFNDEGVPVMDKDPSRFTNYVHTCPDGASVRSEVIDWKFITSRKPGEEEVVRYWCEGDTGEVVGPQVELTAEGILSLCEGCVFDDIEIISSSWDSGWHIPNENPHLGYPAWEFRRLDGGAVMKREWTTDSVGAPVGGRYLGGCIFDANDQLLKVLPDAQGDKDPTRCER